MFNIINQGNVLRTVNKKKTYIYAIYLENMFITINQGNGLLMFNLGNVLPTIHQEKLTTMNLANMSLTINMEIFCLIKACSLAIANKSKYS